MNLARAAGPPITFRACSRAVSLFLGTPRLKHYFPPDVKHCIRVPRRPENQLMLDSEALAGRIRKAMDEAKPPVTGSDLASACKVTPQAVSGWRRTGRILKRHLPTLSRLTGKPLEYFVSDRVPQNHQTSPTKPWLVETVVDEEQFLVVFRTWQDGRANDRQHLTAIAKTARKAHGTRRKRTS
jgi:hypothetical protein